ncbi:MAG: hypothetical protein JF592_10415 [Microbacterium sp.]|uniref:hypothetical protein n=1 Tax=Microbacterium sp. TaxID=51671 RepID=UPI001D8E5F48|nr:hypothetical protein [Microbacterium sp.]MBW8762985.1 hypothetical protein [Microbacterium sp.]
MVSTRRGPGSGAGRGGSNGSHGSGSGSHGGGDNAGDVARSTSKFDEILDKTNSVVDIINGVLELASHIPLIGDLIDKLNELIGRMFEKVNEAIQKTTQIFAFVGNPALLRQTGTSWVQTVGTPATVATSTVVLTALPSTGHWTGASHDAYAARVELQNPASESVYAKCEMVDEQLNTFADAIVDFWVNFSLAVLMTAIGVGLGIAEIVSVWGAPAGVVTIIAEIVAMIADVVSLVDIIMTANQAAADFMTTVTSELSAASAFPGGAWPRHTAA